MNTPTAYLLLVLSAGFSTVYAQETVPRLDHVLHISVDGLRPDVITSLGEQRTPNFYRFRSEGAWTDNARTAEFNTSTIPGHTSQLTGRHFAGDNGHNWWWNSDPGSFELHDTKGYIASVFDVVHDHGGSTALYASKSKFILFENSYDASSGAADRTGEDNGRDKIDTYRYDGDAAALTTTFVADYRQRQYDYAFIHLRSPDSQGHNTGWEVEPETDYARRVVEVDAMLGELFAVVERTPGLAGRTAIILTADHGGELGGKNHGNIFDPDNYTIPFYVWAPGVAEGADLYALNGETRQDPSTRQPSRDEAIQPIRYADVANLALSILDLPSVPGSTLNADQSLRVSPSDDRIIVTYQQGLGGYRGTYDTYVRRHERNSTYGDRTTFVVDGADPWWSGRDNQTLIRFDDLQLPAGAIVQRATLNLRVINPGSGAGFHRMLRPWTEDASWNSLDGGIRADDREAVRIPDAEVSSVDQGNLSVDVTAGLRAWAQGAPNYGWAILPDGGNGWDAYSAEGFMPPRLVISYGFAPYEAKTLPPAAKATNPTANAAVSSPLPESLTVYPNPFQNRATVGYELAGSSKVHLEVYDVTGRSVAVLYDGRQPAGTYRHELSAGDWPAGSYFLRLIAEGDEGVSVLNRQLVLSR